MAKRNVMEAGLGCWLDQQEKNKILKVATKTELEAKVASLELQLHASRQHAQFITEQRNKLLMEKLQLIADKTTLTTEKEDYKARCIYARLTMRDLFPEVRAWLYKIVLTNNWQHTAWPAKFRESWNGLQELAEVISNSGADSTDDESDRENPAMNTDDEGANAN